MRQFLTLIATLSLLTIACAEQGDAGARPPRDQSASSPPSSASTGARGSQKAREMPAHVSYWVIESNIVPGIKRSLDVRLKEKVSEDTLGAIALTLKSRDSRAYERTFITYYLSDMAVGGLAWATTHFDPELEVRILGLTKDEEERLVTEPAESGREIIGRWLDETPFVASRITIFRERGKLFIERKFKDGGSLKTEVVEKQSPLGRRFDKVEGSSAGDHWILDSNGHLQVRDNDGLITTAKKIQ